MRCCEFCFRDSWLVGFIRTNGDDDKGSCDYCGSGAGTTCSLKTVGSFVREGLSRGYEPDPYHDDRDETYSTMEALRDERVLSSSMDGCGDGDRLLRDLLEASAPSADGGKDPARIPLDRFGPDSPLRLIGADDQGDREFDRSWEAFRYYVQHGYRFFDTSDSDETRADILQPLVWLLESLERVLPKHFTLWRARIPKDGDKPHEFLTWADRLGPPPPRDARAGRMNPAGISFFYCGDSMDTCLAEVRPPVGATVWVGKFSLWRELRIVDLTQVPELQAGSIFDREYDPEIRWVHPFLDGFIRDIRKPVLSEGESLDYVPTQVLSEYLRVQGFQGVAYPSSQLCGGTNYALFLGPGSGWEDRWDFGCAPERFEDWVLIEESRIVVVQGISVVVEEQSRQGHTSYWSADDGTR